MDDGTTSNKPEDIKQVFLNFFEQLFAARPKTVKLELKNINHLITWRLSDQQSEMLSSPITE